MVRFCSRSDRPVEFFQSSPGHLLDVSQSAWRIGPWPHQYFPHSLPCILLESFWFFYFLICGTHLRFFSIGSSFISSEKLLILTLPMGSLAAAIITLLQIKNAKYLLPHSLLSKDDTLVIRPNGFIQKTCLWPASRSHCSIVHILPCHSFQFPRYF